MTNSLQFCPTLAHHSERAEVLIARVRQLRERRVVTAPDGMKGLSRHTPLGRSARPTTPGLWTTSWLPQYPGHLFLTGVANKPGTAAHLNTHIFTKNVVDMDTTELIIFSVSGLIVFGILFYPSIKLTGALIRWHRTISPQERANLAENIIVVFFAAVTSGLIMQGLIGFARTEMGLSGPWPYLLFAALDGMAAFFAFVSYRWAKAGASALGPRVMVLLIVAGSAWFQWSHAAGQEFAARVAWSLMPVIAAALWETVLRQRRKQWTETRQETMAGPLIPWARWWWDPWGSLRITRLAAMGHITDPTEALDLYAMKVETQRRLKDTLGFRWRRRVPAEVSVRLRQGLHIREAKELTDSFISQMERDNGTAPDVDPKVFFNAVQHYVQAAKANMAPSERGLCEQFRVSPKRRRWAQKVIAKAKEILDEERTMVTEIEPRSGTARNSESPFTTNGAPGLG